MRIISTLLLSILFVTSLSSQKVYTLKDCILLGIENNLTLDNSRLETAKSKNALSQNRAGLLPVLTGVFQFTDYLLNPVNVTTGTLLGSDFPENPTWQTIHSTQYNTSAGIQLNMPLYNQTILAGIDIAKNIHSIRYLSYEKAVEDLTGKIAGVYYLAQTSMEQERLLDENITRMSTLYDITASLYEQGVVLEVDASRVKINLKNLQARKSQCHTLYEQHLNLLRFLLDLSIDEPMTIEPISREIEPMNLYEADLQMPEILIAEKQVELTGKQIKAIRAGFIPSLALTGYIGGIGYQEHFRNYFKGEESRRNWFGNGYFAVTLRIPIFEANRKRLKVKQYKFEALQAENNLELMQKSVQQRYANTRLQMQHQTQLTSCFICVCNTLTTIINIEYLTINDKT